MNDQQIFQWAVVGAGPAGMAVVGKLIDYGVDPRKIAWIDPAFEVGCFGRHWHNVPSNTKVALFTKFLQECKSFQYDQRDQKFKLETLDPEQGCLLGMMAEPLRWVTNRLRNQVSSIKSTVQSMVMTSLGWQLDCDQETINAKQVVLATGSEAKQFSYSEVEMISMTEAMNPEVLKETLSTNDTVAVFGSSHSAILAIRNCVEAGVGKVINFYRSALKYAVHMEGWILHDDTGLKGSTAQWAREHMNGGIPNLERYYSDEHNIGKHLPQCNKVIYAIGFERRHLPVVQGVGEMEYDAYSGIIAPGLFGFGIGFPEAKISPLGALEYRVGLWKFMDYLNRVMPVWLAYY